jgi:hypothetical protein
MHRSHLPQAALLPAFRQSRCPNDNTASVVLWNEMDLELLHRIEDGTALRCMKIALAWLL